MRITSKLQRIPGNKTLASPLLSPLSLAGLRAKAQAAGRPRWSLAGQPPHLPSHHQLNGIRAVADVVSQIREFKWKDNWFRMRRTQQPPPALWAWWESDLENQMQRSVPKHWSLVSGIVEPISLRNWSGSLIKRDKSLCILSRLKILGVIDFPWCFGLMRSCQDHRQPLARPNSMQVIKAILFFNGKFWLILISLASRRLICTRPSLLWRLQSRRANGKERWSSNCEFVIIAQLRGRLSSHGGPCDQSPPHTPLFSYA